PSTFSQLFSEGPDAFLEDRVPRRVRHQNSNSTHALALLRAHGKRPPNRRTAKKCDELAPLHACASVRTAHNAESQRLALNGANVRFGSQADICAATSDVCFTPDSDHKSGHVPMVMSALPPKADMCGALAYVCFGPKADMLRAETERPPRGGLPEIQI